MQNNKFKHINTYTSGMNQDLSSRLYDNKHYFEAEWMTPLNNETSTVGALTNPKGNIEKIIFAPTPNIGDSKHIIIGDAPLRDKRIIVTNKRSLGVNNYKTYIYEFTDDGTSNSQTADASGLGNVTTGNFRLLWTDDSSINSAILTTNDKLGYNTSSKLDIVTRYESSTVQKIYIACEGFPLRYFNIIYNVDTNDYTQFTEKDFNITPSVNLSKCTFDEYALGGMLAGVVVYAYQLYRVNGSETAFSETSERVVISNSVNRSSTIDLYGSDKETVTGVGVKMSISDLDTTFDRIRVIAIHYEDYYIEPSIRIVYEASYDSSSLTFVDIGDSLGTYDLAEFRVFNQYFIKPIHLTTKNNMLFAANMEEEYFDLDEYLITSGQTSILTTDAGGTGKQFWDARVYRFDGQSPRQSKVRIASGAVEYTLLSTTHLYDNIPYNHDCYSEYNDTESNGYYYNNPTLQEKYDINGTIGASGKNVNIQTTYSTFTLDDNSEYQTFQTTSIGQEEILGRWASWQRDEIYRLSIQFEDYLGRKSYPKYSCDFRMRDYIDGAGLISGSQMVNLYPQVSIATGKIPLNPDGSKMKWRVMRVERDSANKTVIGTGVVSGTLNDATSDVHHDTDLYGPIEIMDAKSYSEGKFYKRNNSYISNVNKQYLQLITPEVFFTNIGLDNCYLSHQGFYRSSTLRGKYRTDAGASALETTWTEVPNTLSYDNGSYQFVTKYNMFENTASRYTSASEKLVNIDKFKKIKAQPLATYDAAFSYYTIGNKLYKNINYADNSPEWHEGENGSCYLIKLTGRDNADYFSYNSLPTNSANAVITVLIKKDGYPYGGSSYQAKLNSVYIPASEFYTSENTYEICFYGDTYVGYFDYLRTMYNYNEVNPQNDFIQEVLYIPVESQYNLNLRTDTGFNKIANMSLDPSYKLTEEGVVDVDSGIELAALYRYNTVYSKQNNSESYNAIPLDANSNYEYDTRIRRSEIKSNGEYADSWLKFLQNNYIDVDGQYGEITRLDVFKDKLLFWQPKALGTVPVGEKELIPSSNSSTLALGSSGILNRYDYIDDSAGASQKDAVLVTPTSIVFFSSYRNTMFRYSGQNQPISDVLGMNSWFDQYVNMSTNIISGYNPLLWECWFTFGNYTLIFNDNHNIFSYFVPTVIPDRYMTHNNVMYMWRNSISSTGYKHNVGNYGQLFGTYLTSSVTLLINPRGTIMNIFDVIEIFTEKYATDGITELQETFDSIQIYNDYQDTGEISLVPGDNIIRRLRTWRFNTIRDNASEDPKVRSSYIKVKLKFTNSSANEKIILHNLTTNYRLSKMMG